MSNFKTISLIIFATTLYAILLSTTMFHLNDSKLPARGLRFGYKKKISSKVNVLYKKFLALFGKVPTTPSENHFRMEEFAKNLERIEKMRVKYYPKTKFDINKFALETSEEFKSRLKGSVEMTESDIKMIKKGEFDKLRKSKMKKSNIRNFKKLDRVELMDLRVNLERVMQREMTIEEQKKRVP